jgi:glycosyltransferase involved in cell wall biosynthesis
MKIGIHTKELENDRIDGTMMYMRAVLSQWSDMDMDDEFLLYHTRPYNKYIKVGLDHHFRDRVIADTPLWTQSNFARHLMRDRCDVLWMPLHNIPYFRRRDMRTVVTIHDLAFKYFPDTFPRKDMWKLTIHTDHAVRASDKIIAVSTATKNDILAFYPDVPHEKIDVVHHGFDMSFWLESDHPSQCNGLLEKYGVEKDRYIIHVGAIQPRKNLVLLSRAFVEIKKDHPDMKLVLVGGEGWLAKEVKRDIQKVPYYEDIVFTGQIDFTHVRTLMRNACVFAFPSRYEGFGLPALEALASGVPVVAAKNSSLPEVLGDAAVYFDTDDHHACASALRYLIEDSSARIVLQEYAHRQMALYSWERCAVETYEVIKSSLID